MGTLKGIYTGIALCCFLMLSSCGAQTTENGKQSAMGYPPEEILLPDFLREAYAIRDFVRNLSPLHPGLGATDSLAMAHDLDRVDTIYAEALSLTHNNRSEALLICALACLTHKAIPFTFGLRFPLTFESDSAYRQRYENIPRFLFRDGASGDADKLQHFFGSAYLTIMFDNPTIPEGIGLAIEIGESGIVQGEDIDQRDVRANRLGQAFSLLLERKPNLLPSTLFRYWNKTGKVIIIER